MDLQTALNITAACIGFISACWLSLGAAFARPKSIAFDADPPWDSAEADAKALASQSAQSLVGSLLLLLAFAFQIWGFLTPASTPLTPYLAQFSNLCISLLASISAVVLGLLVYFPWRAWLIKKSLEIITKKLQRDVMG